MTKEGVAGSEGDLSALLTGYARLGQLYLLYGFERAAEDCFANARNLAPEDARWSYYLGVSLERQARYQEAAAAFERVIAARPGDQATLLRLGWMELEMGRPDRAEEWFLRALDTEHDSAAALFGLGQVAVAHERWSEAARRFRRVLELQPGASAVHYPLGMALRELGDLEGAREHLARRGSRAPTFPDPLVTDLITLAEGAWHHLERGRKLMEGGDLGGALESFRAAVEGEPTNVHAYKSLANALALRGDLVEAVEQYEAALELDPAQPQVHRTLGVYLVRGGKLDEGIHHLRRAVELAPDFVDAYLELAAALERAGRIGQAVEAAGVALDLRPEDSAARLRYGRLLLLSRIDLAGDLEGQLRRLLEEDPGDATAWLTLGAVLGARGDDEGRVEAFGKVLELEGNEPTKARAHMLLADREAARSGVTDRVLSHLHSATRLAPDLAVAHLSLARALERRGHHLEAAGAYRRVLSLEPAHSDSHVGLVKSLLATGRNGEALRSLTKALAVAPADPRLRELLQRLEDE